MGRSIECSTLYNKTEKQAKRMLVLGVIQLGDSPYSSSVIRIKKKDGNCCFALNIELPTKWLYQVSFPFLSLRSY